MLNRSLNTPSDSLDEGWRRPLVSLVSVNYGNARLLADCAARTIAALRDVPFEYLLVDNKSPDDSYEFLKAHFQDDPRMRVVQSSRNGGFGFGCNVGAHAARSPVIWFLNSDAWIEDASGLREALRCFDLPETGLLGTAVALHDGTRIPQGGGRMSFIYLALSSFRPGKLFRTLPAPLARLARKASPWAPYTIRSYLDGFEHAAAQTIFAADLAGGGSFLIGRKTFSSLGGFDERFFLYDEDIDLCTRVVAAGRKIYIQPHIVVKMYPSATTSRLASLQLKRIKRQSRHLLISKHFVGWKRHVLLLVTAITWRLL